MTSLLLCASPELDPTTVAPFFAGYGLQVKTCVLSNAGDQPVHAEVDEAVLMTRESGMVVVGETLSRLVERLPRSAVVTVCAPLSSPKERRLLEECGAQTVVEPPDWLAASVADRVLAELILRGRIALASGSSLRGATQLMQSLDRELSTVAPLADPVLILGETGVGKELVAHEIHARSGRPGELLPINVAALSPELMASELFGHERGAFTSAIERRRGLMAEAGAGTIFLDEIGDLELHAQASLLRVLEELRVRPVGGNQWQPIRARILFATNRDLDEDCAEGRFRRDLYERLRGLPIRVPPLRKRKADIPLLVHHFLDAFNRENPGRRWVPPGALDPLFRHDWPGNVRELRQVVREAAVFATSPEGQINKERLRDATLSRLAGRRPRDTSPSPPEGSPFLRTISFDPEGDTLQAVRDRAESQYLHSLLALTSGNKTAAAEKAGISLSQLYALLKKKPEG